MTKVYWTMHNGEKIDIDKMDTNHLRNTLKMIVRVMENKRKEFARKYAEKEADKMFAKDIEDDMFDESAIYSEHHLF